MNDAETSAPEGAPASEGQTHSDPPPPLPPQQRPRPVRRLRRASDAPLGGVATGFANYFDVSPLVFQIGFVAAVAFGGFGAFAYIACWFLIPTESDPETRPVTITSDTTRVVLGALFAVLAASSSFTLGQNTFEITLVPLLLVGAGFYLLNQRQRSDEVVAEPFVPMATPTDTTHWATIDPDDRAELPPPAPPGPPVTAVTLAVVAVAVGLLLALNQFGATIPAAAFFGTALAIIGGGLVYGAFRGRPRGLVPLGILLAMGLAVAPGFDTFDGGTGPREYSPVDESAVRDLYELGAGPLELDLRRVEFTEDHTIEVNVGAGYAEIWLPIDVNVNVEASTRAGYIELFGRENAGLLADATASRSAPPGAPTITLDAEVTFGYVEVRRG